MDELIEKNGKIYDEDGNVAVIVSSGYGAGWSTWNSDFSQECLFDPDCVRLTLAGKRDELETFAESKWKDGYWGGAKKCDIYWLKPGTVFKVREYDGSESLEFQDSPNWFVA
jgi:hypothetical protein